MAHSIDYLMAFKPMCCLIVQRCILNAYTSLTMKSPKPKIRLHDSPFKKEDKIWLVTRCALMLLTELRWACINRILCPKCKHHEALERHTYFWLVARFKETGAVTGRGKATEKAQTKVTQEMINQVKQLFTTNKKTSIRTANLELELSYGTIWRILQK